MDLATDYLSIPARSIVPLLAHVETSNSRVTNARERLLNWDYKLEPNSVTAGIYVAMERRIQRSMHALFVPARARDVIRSVSMTKIVDWLTAPPGEFGEDPIAGRDEFLARALADAVNDLGGQLGSDMDNWQLGQSEYKHVLIRHPLSAAVNDAVRRTLDAGPRPRGGNSYTVNNTGGGNNQTSGPSFRIIVDTGDWDRTVGTNTPGQGGDPDDPHYRDLFDLWATDRFFPLFYSRHRVESVADRVTMLHPAR